MQSPLYKIILCDYINPEGDTQSTFLRQAAVVLKRWPVPQKGIPFKARKLPSPYRIWDVGPEKTILNQYKSKKSIEVISKKGFLMMPSFFDIHFHWVQDKVRLMPKDSLLEWLVKYTWPYEAKFKDKSYSKKAAKSFSQELLSVGTLGGGCFASIHGHSVDHGLENFLGDFTMGNVLMTMNSPEYLLQRKADALKLIEKKGQKYKEGYAITPRFALTTDPDVMLKGSRVAKSHRCFIQSHLSETEREIEAVLSLYQDIEGFEKIKTYTEIYHACGLLGPKTIMGHGIYLGPHELKLLSKTQTILAHCPTSNAPVEDLGLGSGLFPFKKVEKSNIRWALGSDIGGGPFLSMFDVIQSFVKQNKQKKVAGATYEKGLYRATLAGAEALGQEKTAGNLSPKKWANFLLVESPKLKKGENVNKVLQQVIDPFSKSREEYRNLVQETYFRGEMVYSK